MAIVITRFLNLKFVQGKRLQKPFVKTLIKLYKVPHKNV